MTLNVNIFEYSIFILCITLILFLIVFFYHGGTIFDLLSLPNFVYVYKEITTEIKEVLERNQKNKLITVAENNEFIYTSIQQTLIFDPLLNSIIVKTKNNGQVTIPMSDTKRLVPLFVRFNKVFDS